MFQGGISWKVVDAKWDGIGEAFHRFDPEWVATLTPAQIDRLANDPRVIRNRSKIEGSATNARTLLELDAAHGTVRRYLRSFADLETTAADLTKRFRYVGDSGAYHFL